MVEFIKVNSIPEICVTDLASKYLHSCTILRGVSIK